MYVRVIAGLRSTPRRLAHRRHRAGGSRRRARVAGAPRNEERRADPALAACGPWAIEVYHSSHDPATEAHYLALAERMAPA